MDEKRARSPSPRPPTAGLSDHTRIASPGDHNNERSTTPFSLSGRTPTLFNLRRASRAPTIIPRSTAITRQNLIASAERIYYRYLSPAANTVNTENHEIYLPPSLRIHSFPLSSSQDPKTQSELNMLAQIPDMFHAQKEYCFRAMEQDAFPRFLRSKAFGNLTPVSALVRLIAGLIILWIGLAVGFALIFLDVQPKSRRFWVRFSLSLLLVFLARLTVLAALPPLHVGNIIPGIPSIRTRSNPSIPRPVRDDAIQDVTHSRTLRAQIVTGKSNLGDDTRGGNCDWINSLVLGSAGTQAVELRLEALRFLYCCAICWV